MADKPENQSLDSFKIGDLSKPTVGSRVTQKHAASTTEESSPHPSLTLQRLLDCLDDATEDEVVERVEALRQKIELFKKEAKGLQDQAAAKQGARSVKHTQELLLHLFEIRRKMMESKDSEAQSDDS